MRSYSLQIRAGSLYYIGLSWSWTTPPGHTLSGIRIFHEVWAQAAFFWLKRALSRSVQQFWRFFCRKNATRKEHRTLSIVFRASKPKEVNHLRTAPFLDIWAPFYHHGNGDAAAPAHPRYLKPFFGSVALQSSFSLSCTYALWEWSVSNHRLSRWTPARFCTWSNNRGYFTKRGG